MRSWRSGLIAVGWCASRNDNMTDRHAAPASLVSTLATAPRAAGFEVRCSRKGPQGAFTAPLAELRALAVHATGGGAPRRGAEGSSWRLDGGAAPLAITRLGGDAAADDVERATARNCFATASVHVHFAGPHRRSCVELRPYGAPLHWGAPDAPPRRVPGRGTTVRLHLCVISPPLAGLYAGTGVTKHLQRTLADHTQPAGRRNRWRPARRLACRPPRSSSETKRPRTPPHPNSPVRGSRRRPLSISAPTALSDQNCRKPGRGWRCGVQFTSKAFTRPAAGGRVFRQSRPRPAAARSNTMWAKSPKRVFIILRQRCSAFTSSTGRLDSGGLWPGCEHADQLRLMPSSCESQTGGQNPPGAWSRARPRPCLSTPPSGFEQGLEGLGRFFRPFLGLVLQLAQVDAPLATDCQRRAVEFVR